MDAKKTYQAVAAFALLFLLLSIVWKIEWAPLVGLGVIAVCLLIPPLALLVAKGWYALGHGLGRINSFIIMSVLFWVFILPVGYLRKLFSNAKPSTDNTFKTVNKTYTAEDFERPW
ncbi:MAG: SxtJ family membrane protein [Sphingobacteriales bacterium JAD_PAG50586_3]|nr:MAG: SxtJ family membrane protein [Sphingobacteriales bacterium JAD_PAG50586_3]